MSIVTLKGNTVHIYGTLPKIGIAAPDFILANQNLENCTLKNFPGKILLSIVPSLDTSTCLISAQKFNQHVASIPNTTLLYVSADLPFAQKRVCGAESLDHVQTLSLMRNKDFARSYGVLIEDGPLEGVCTRAIIVLNENHHVTYTELVPEITQEPNYDAAIASLI